MDKCSKIKKVGEPIVHRTSGDTYGAWMRDPLGVLGAGNIWYINDYYNNQVLEFESMNHFKAGVVKKTYTLPYHIHGTGSVVYGRYLYFNRFVHIFKQQTFFSHISMGWNFLHIFNTMIYL